ncbi:MAG TPA: 4Fe-4S dicluster domain-containing protein, partial [Polyangiaceae bacterium]
DESGDSPSRMYVVESRLSLTGCVADHRFELSSSAMLPLLAQLAVVLTKLQPGGLDSELRQVLEHLGAPFAAGAWGRRLEVMASDFVAERGRSVVLVGAGQPPLLHALGHWINERLANVGSTVRYLRPFDDTPVSPQVLTELSYDILNRTVKTVLVLGGNPLFTAPSDSGIKDALASAELTIHCGTHYDESGRSCHWHLNLAHELEAWGDAVARDGTVSIVQPMLHPLWDGRTAAEVVTLLSGTNESSYALVRDEWKARWGAAPFEQRWRQALLDGAFNDGLEELKLFLNQAAIARAAAGASTVRDESLELVLVPDPNLGDGRYANNGWLQELPHPITKTTWGNPAWISEALARQYDMRDGQVARITANGTTLRVPVLIVPGQYERTIALALGGGHWHLGKVANGVGVNAHSLRSIKEPWIIRVERFEATGEHVNISRTQSQFDELGRGLTRIAPVAPLRAATQSAPSKPTRLSSPSERVSAWGMVIDLAKCTGCSACVVACESENNTPFVGSDGSERGRAMQWLRVDRYFTGALGALRSSVQPMPCQQCENAPCETVCPVGATAHSAEGLNDMVYNRCVGSRYCANNCPFEVRRFNYFEYGGGLSDVEQLRMNPDVSVRSRGVMEKCTFCVQRIQRARIAAKLRQETHIADGAVTTACEQVCPTRAIIFGDLNDASSRVAALRQDPRAYRLLDELNLEPRVYYLAGSCNPHPELVTS